MNNLLSYKRFKAKIEFSADDKVFFGRLIGIRDVVTFHGETDVELKQTFRDAVEFHLELSELSERSSDRP